MNHGCASCAVPGVAVILLSLFHVRTISGHLQLMMIQQHHCLGGQDVSDFSKEGREKQSTWTLSLALAYVI